MKKYDIVLVAHEKDFNNIKFIVDFCQKNLEFDSVHLILSERQEFNDLELVRKLTDKPVFKHNESDILQVDKTRIKYRPNWIYQMLLKMFQNVTLNDNFLVIEADCVILSKLNFFDEDGRTTFFLARNQYHEQYFNFNKLFGFGREYDHSFISEFIMYDKKIINSMLRNLNCDSVSDFLNIIYNEVNENCYPADYELYGNYCFKFHKDEIIIKNLTYNFFGRDIKKSAFWTDDEIISLIETNLDKDVISFHTWGAN